MSKRCRWGILGTAGIAQKNWKAIWHAENATITAVASRSMDRAQAFIDACQASVHFDPAPEAVGSYEALLARDDVDAVYIPLPTGLRTEWAIKAAEAGKHVLGEKPSGKSAAEVQAILDACAANGVQYMDGVMYMHSTRLDAIKPVLHDAERIGELKRIATQFSFRAPDDFLAGNIRLNSDLEPYGCLGDLGWYTVRFILWAKDFVLPERVCGHLLQTVHRADSPEAVPVEFSGELFYADGFSASFYNSFLTEHQQWVNASGSKGYLALEDFVLPYFGSSMGFDVCNHHFHIDGCEFNYEPRKTRVTVPEYASGQPNAQETNLFRNFSRLVLAGTPDSTWGEMTLKTQQVLDAC
ncbi:MAG: putative dehydrogenase, partial [Candidatus Omnitrophota bacterium]